MARTVRLTAHSIVYHVIARGNSRLPVFYDSSDYQRFLSNLERYRLAFHFRLYAYCLMPNHFHLLLETKDVTVSKIMQVMLTAYTMYSNKKRKQAGHVFAGRFKNIAVEKEIYLLPVLRYIHLVPVKAGLVDTVQMYPWASYGKYVTPGDSVPFIDTDIALGLFSDDHFKQKQLFVEHTLSGLGVPFDPEEDNVRGVLGSAKFILRLTKVRGGSRP